MRVQKAIETKEIKAVEETGVSFPWLGGVFEGSHLKHTAGHNCLQMAAWVCDRVFEVHLSEDRLISVLEKDKDVTCCQNFKESRSVSTEIWLFLLLPSSVALVGRHTCYQRLLQKPRKRTKPELLMVVCENPRKRPGAFVQNGT